MLDPKYAGKSILSGAEINKAYGVITTVSRHLGLDEGKVLGSLAKYTSKQGLWDGDAIWQSCQHISSATWWKGLCGSEALSPVASIILQIPPTSAASERNWSLFGNTHTKARNRLTITRVEKLVTTSHPQQGWKVTVKMRPQSLMFKRWTLRRSREKTWKPERKTTKALVPRLLFYRCMLKTFLGDVMDHWGSFNIPFLLLFSEIIPCEESTHLNIVQFVTKLFFFISIGRI